jgi:molecular chaperone DnaK (HSP70)
VDDYTDEIKFVVRVVVWQICLKCYIVFYIQMLASASDSHLGGRDIDLILAEHFSNDFRSRYRIDPRNNPRAFLRLTTEVEKLKKQMSANSTTLPMNIECFMDDKDVHGDMKRYGNDVQFVNYVFQLIGQLIGKVQLHTHMCVYLYGK